MKKILPYFKPYKAESLLGPLFKLLEATFELVVPFIVALIIDKGLGARVDGGYPYADKSYIAIMCAVLGGFGLVGLVCAVTAQYFAAKAATGVSTQLRKALFAKLQSLSYSDMDTLGTSAMLTRMTNDVNQLQSGINMVLRLFLRSPFIVFGAMIMAFFIDRHSALVFVGTIPVLSAVVFAVMLVCMPLYKKSQGKLDKVLLSTRENLTGARVLRAFCKEDDEKRLFAERNGELTKSQKFVGGISALMNPLTYALINGAIIVLIYVGALRVDYGNLSQGSVLALYNLMTQILVELIKLANLIITVTKAAACGSRIEGVLDMESSLKLLPAGEENTSAGGKGEGSIVSESGETLQAFVEFDRVSMRYKGGGENSLTDIDFRLKRGETVGVIGGTGSGKTTLVNLVPHFYDVTEGSVRVAGKDVRAYDPKVLRDKIGVVPQKAVLFKGTIRENLQWGKADATDEELMAAARAAQADKVIEDKGGLDAPVEQGGRNFSGGQKQRLTIARALVRRPEILILDDSASALDYATDAALRRALKELDYAPTVFVVSQRTSAMNGADKIVVLDEGRAAGIGTHEELLKDCPVYREIYESQHKKEGGERRAEA
ncbi:MAG: ABC transporter ATP-binding protein [Christensenellaceae bacterium]|nr:ABC transporter ATP-binding protein [Clostridia bacterium]PWL99159.1 MAG: ATP-binding protein [Clostridiales bacterium]PWM02122.1 MAG: ATP-binding protein [Clostridiales bacterium]